MAAWTSAAILALLGSAAATSSVAACARFGVDGGGDGDRAASNATDPAVPGDTLAATEASGKGGPATPTSVSARVVRLGTTATMSALVPTEAFVAVVAKLGSQLNLSLCTGIGIQQLEESVRQASDMPLAGAQSPSVACTAISLGATLTGVVDGLPPATQPSGTMCPL
jgi:hypothetical protein